MTQLIERPTEQKTCAMCQEKTAQFETDNGAMCVECTAINQHGLWKSRCIEGHDAYACPNCMGTGWVVG